MRHAVVLGLTLAALVLLTPGRPSASPDTLDEVFRESVRHHPRLRALYQEWQSALHRVAESRGWPDPRLSYTWYVESVETALGPQEHALALSQTIPWFGKLGARGDAAEETALALEQRFRAEQLRLYEDAARIWFELAYLDRALAVTDESLQLLAQSEEVLRSRYRVNRTRYSDLLRLETEVARLRDHRRSLSERRVSVAFDLNEALGRPLDTPPPASVSLESELAAPVDSVLRAAVATDHPDLAQLEHDIRATEHRVDLARKQGWPDLRVGVTTILTGESELTDFEDAGRDAWMATVSIDLPIFRGKVNGGVDAAVARRRATEHRLVDRRRQLLREMESALFARSDAHSTERLYAEEVVPRARKAMEATLTDYTGDRAAFLDFIDSQRQLLRFQLELARARADRLQAEARLLSLANAGPRLSSEEVSR